MFHTEIWYVTCDNQYSNGSSLVDSGHTVDVLTNLQLFIKEDFEVEKNQNFSFDECTPKDPMSMDIF